MKTSAMRTTAMRSLLISALAIFFAAPTVRTQTTVGTTRELAAIRADLEHIKADQEIVRTQLAQILRIISQRPAQARPTAAGLVRANVAGAPSLGRADAPVTIVEFSDYQCPFCQRFYTTTFAALKKEYIDVGKVRYVFRDYPLEQLHSHARKAAEAAHCAGEQGKYWQMHDALFQSQGALDLPQLAEHARSLGLDGPTFDRCLSSDRNAVRIDRGLAEGAAAGVQGTPAFVIGRTKAGDMVEGTSIRGAQSQDTFRQIIEQLLARGERGGGVP
jgi:protein-disulfide isomerase